MNRAGEVFGHGDNNVYNRFQRFISQFVWASIIVTLKLAFPAFLLTIAILVMVTFSILMYGVLKSWMLPKAVLAEPLFFDFTQTTPSAIINISSTQNQWYLVKDMQPLDCGQKLTTICYSRKDALQNRFLKSGTSYSIDLHLVLSKSPRNLLMGKFMLFLVLFDSSGGPVAKAARPVAVPFQSGVSLLMDAVAKYPFRLIGLIDSAETVPVTINFMKDYNEPLLSLPPTELLEFRLSTADADIMETRLTIMPSLSGIT